MISASPLEEANAELKLRLHQQGIAAEFANFGLKTDELQPVLDEACRVAAIGMECSFAKVLHYLEREDCFIMQAGIGWKPGTVGHARLGTDLASPAGFAFRTGQPVLSNHLAHDTRFRTPDLLVEHGVHRAFNVLIDLPEGRYGVLEVDSPDTRAFTSSDIAFLQNLAATLANAIAKQQRILSLHRSSEFANSMLEASPDCVKVIDDKGNLELINNTGVCLFGLDDAHEIIGRPWEDLWPEEQRGKIRDVIAQAKAGGTGRLEILREDGKGKPKWWEIQVTPIAGADGKLLAISRDVSDRVAANESKDLLMLEVHHRVRNSLQLVQNLLSLQSRVSNDDQAAVQLRQSAARIRTIAAIHDRLYKTETALTVDIGPYLEGLVEDLRNGLASSLDGRSIKTSIDPVIWSAQEVPTLGLVLTELVTNALKYGAGSIHVTFRQPPGSNGTLTVWDEGEGLAEDFDPAQSRGLGMCLINGLLRGDGAGLEIDRRQNYTCFIAHLPPARAFAS